jgi:uncharacterized membrane protein HdeD (DUF308 family)
MRRVIVRTLAILAVPFVLGGLAAMVFAIVAGGSGAVWVFAFGLLTLVTGGLCAVSALIVSRPTSGWPRLARRVALFLLGLLCIVVASFRFDVSEPYSPLLLLAGVAALALLVMDIREAGGEADD